MITKEDILNKLEDVKDPEIPKLSVVELGVITGIDIKENDVKITMTPTFAGCPALDVMQKDIKRAVSELPINNVEVNVSFETSWNSNMITERGKQILKESGFALPPRHNGVFQIDIFNNIKCPLCGSDKTKLQTPFGPTLCRAIHYCNNCHQAFEQFKPV